METVPRAPLHHRIGTKVKHKLRWVRFSGEAVATIGLFVFAFGLHVAVAPTPLVFLERDPTLSYPLVRPETVPVWLLFTLSISIPASFIAMGHVWHGIKRKSTLRGTIQSFLWCLLGILQALALTFAITNLLKFMTGRQRPNFYALCDYAGYREGVISGDMNDYRRHTAEGTFGDISKCRGDFQDVADSMRSFPSGHSSVSFAGMMFATLYLRASFGVGRGVYVSVLSILSTLPLVVSAWIAISRVRDRWHNTDDVFIGSCIGLISGYMAWRHYVTLRREGLAPKHGAAHINPLEDAEMLPVKLPNAKGVVAAAIVTPMSTNSDFSEMGEQVVDADSITGSQSTDASGGQVENKVGLRRLSAAEDPNERSVTPPDNNNKTPSIPTAAPITPN